MVGLRKESRSRLARLAVIGFAVAVSACSGSPSGNRPASPSSGFNVAQAYFPGAAPSPQWPKVIARHQQALQAPERVPQEWLRLLDELGDLDLRGKVERVNSAINRYPYVRSERNWGRPDYWATPFEFLARNGQCQDYAVAKYFLLRASGVPAEQLRIVVVHDSEAGLAHAAVLAHVDGEALLLDNQIPEAVSAATVRHYRPLYAMNESGWWVFKSWQQPS